MRDVLGRPTATCGTGRSPAGMQPRDSVSHHPPNPPREPWSTSGLRSCPTAVPCVQAFVPDTEQSPNVESRGRALSKGLSAAEATPKGRLLEPVCRQPPRPWDSLVFPRGGSKLHVTESIIDAH